MWCYCMVFMHSKLAWLLFWLFHLFFFHYFISEIFHSILKQDSKVVIHGILMRSGVSVFFVDGSFSNSLDYDKLLLTRFYGTQTNHFAIRDLFLFQIIDYSRFVGNKNLLRLACSPSGWTQLFTKWDILLFSKPAACIATFSINFLWFRLFLICKRDWNFIVTPSGNEINTGIR